MPKLSFSCASCSHEKEVKNQLKLNILEELLNVWKQY